MFPSSSRRSSTYGVSMLDVSLVPKVWRHGAVADAPMPSSESLMALNQLRGLPAESVETPFEFHEVR